MAGWISLHRKLMDNPIYSNANMLKLWIHCLMKASHSGHDQLVGNQMVKLGVGEFVTGRNALADEFNKGAKKSEVISAITLWRWLKNFEDWQMLNIKTTTKYSVITILNWSEHQGNEQQVNSKRTTDEQQVNTINNVNNDNNDNKKEPSRKRVYDESSIHFKLANRLYQKILVNNPNHKKPNLQNWANDVRLMMERDKRNEEQITYLIDWCQSNEFWKSNILSISKLREKYDQLVIQIKSNRGKTAVPAIPVYEEVKPVEKRDGTTTNKFGNVQLFR